MKQRVVRKLDHPGVLKTCFILPFHFYVPFGYCKLLQQNPTSIQKQVMSQIPASCEDLAIVHCLNNDTRGCSMLCYFHIQSSSYFCIDRCTQLWRCLQRHLKSLSALYSTNCSALNSQHYLHRCYKWAELQVLI